MSGKPGDLALVQSFYRALAVADIRAIARLLADDFFAETPAGLPRGWGGAYHGRDQMLWYFWGPVLFELPVRPVPDEMLLVGDKRIAVLGRYRALADPGRGVEPRFAHFLQVRGGRIAELVEVCDTAEWARALDATRAEREGSQMDECPPGASAP